MNVSHLGNRKKHLQRGLGRDYVSFREGNIPTSDDHQQIGISRNFQRIHLSLQGLDFVRDRLADSLQLLGAPCGSDPERGKRHQ